MYMEIYNLYARWTERYKKIRKNIFEPEKKEYISSPLLNVGL